MNLMASEIGQALREARLANGIDLAEAQRVTKIRTTYLQALEEERWQVLPGPSYVRGFLRTYAKYLGLDADEIVSRYRGEHREEEAPGPIPRDMLPHAGEVQPHPHRTGRIVAVLAAALVAVIAIVAISGGDGERSTAGPLDPDAPEPNLSEATDATEPTDETTTETEPEPAAEPVADQVKVSLTATGPVWVCLTTGDGKERISGETLAADEQRGPFKAKAFTVTLGNGSVAMEIDNEPFEIPARAEPQGYRINAAGARELDSAEQPTCA